MTKYLIVSGDRNYNNIDVINDTFVNISKTYLPTEYTFINGGCKGADLLTEKIAKKYNYKSIKFPADWKKYGLGAGPIRNAEMLKLNPELVLIFHDNLSSSKGTRNFITQLYKKMKKEDYKPLILFNGNEIEKLI